MPTYPLLVRYKDADGKWSARVHADTPEQARDFLNQWREQGFTDFDIEDPNGQQIDEASIK